MVDSRPGAPAPVEPGRQPARPDLRVHPDDTGTQRPAAEPPKPDPLLPLAPSQLAVSAVAAAVTALLLSGLRVERLGQSWLGAMAAAAVTSIVATVLQTRGRLHWLRLSGGAALAFALAVTGISLPELGLQRALTNQSRRATFVPPQLAPPTTATPTTTTTATTTTTTGPTTTTEPLPGPHIAIDATTPVTCPGTPVGQVGACPAVTIRSTGSQPLVVSSFELVQPAAGEFEVVDGSGCVGRTLGLDETCTVQLTFRPSLAGPRSARLVVHQNLPSPDAGTSVELIGQGTDGPTTP
jgi:hypothetical protein